MKIEKPTEKPNQKPSEKKAAGAIPTQIDGIDSDPVESRIYTGGLETYCVRCGRLRNKKATYMLNDGSYCCYDDTIKKNGINDGVLCLFMQMVKEFCKIQNIHLSVKSLKQLEKWLSDQA